MEVQTGPVASSTGQFIQGMNMMILGLTVAIIMVAVVFIIRFIQKKGSKQVCLYW